MTLKATRDAYGEWLLEKGAIRKDIVVVDADLSESTKTNKFANAYPERFFDVGSAEQNLIGVSAGLALGGKKVFASSFAIFETGRAWDQIRNVVAHDNLDVAMVASHGGFSCAADGASHQALEDIGLMRIIPNMRVIMPCDFEETQNALDAILERHGPFYMRLRREKEPILEKNYDYELGKAETMRDGDDLTIVTSGMLVYNALQASKLLKNENYDVKVINVHTIKPIDKKKIIQAAKDTSRIITVEEHSISCGLGGSICEVLSENYPTHVHRLGVHNSFGQSSRTMKELLEEYKLNPEGITNVVKEIMQKEKK
jgi:transketolase